jgi:hypothetical protein
VLFLIREGRMAQQVGCKGRDKGRYTTGIRLWWLLNDAEKVVEWHWLPLDRPDKDFEPLAAAFDGGVTILTNQGFRDKNGLPRNLKLCPKGTWNERMIVETAFSITTVVSGQEARSSSCRSSLVALRAYLAAMFDVVNALFISCSRMTSAACLSPSFRFNRLVSLVT